MNYEQESNEAMSLKDLLMRITRDQIREAVASATQRDDINNELVNEIADSIHEILQTEKGALVDKTEFEAIRTLLESQIPETGEMEIGDGINSVGTRKFSLNTLDGKKDALYESVQDIHQSMAGKRAQNGLESTLLRESFEDISNPHALQKVLFVNNYNSLMLDVRAEIKNLIDKGIRVIVSREKGEQFPGYGYAKLDQNFIESPYLNNERSVPANIIQSPTETPLHDKIAA